MINLLKCQAELLTRCSSKALFSLTVLVSVIFLYLTCLATTQSLSLPRGPLFSLLVLVTLALCFGQLVNFIRAPPMLGMLVIGICLSNIPYVKERTVLDPKISSALKTVSLIIILMKGGLSLDIMNVKRVGFAVIRLAVLPCFVEAMVFAVLSVFLLNMPWIWAFMLGFVIAAVTPAIIVPCLMELKKRMFKIEENNIITMLVSASSFDDVIAISAFMVCLSSAFSSDKSLVLQIFQGPIEIILGVVLGIPFGMVLWVLPPTPLKGRTTSQFRCVLILLFSLFSVFGMSFVNFSGSGPLSVIVMSLTAIKGWNDCEDGYVIDVVDKLWFLAEPLLFGLVGRDIQLGRITLDLLWRSLIVIFVALIFRCFTAFLSVSWTTLTLKERIFVSISWIPKATVQAAIGSYALTMAHDKDIDDDDPIIGYCETILMVTVMVILICGPLGALLMYFTAPVLLDKVVEQDTCVRDYDLVADIGLVDYDLVTETKLSTHSISEDV